MAESLASERAGTPVSTPPPDAPVGAERPPSWQAAARWVVPIAIGLAIWATPVPEGVEPAGWTLLAIFVATIAGIIAKPAPMGVVAIIGLTFTTKLVGLW